MPESVPPECRERQATVPDVADARIETYQPVPPIGGPRHGNREGDDSGVGSTPGDRGNMLVFATNQGQTRMDSDMLRKRMWTAAFALAMFVALGHGVRASQCPFRGQQPMLVVQLFFGQGVEGRGTISQSAWRSFLQQAVTPRFADGFTVYDTRGQWMNPNTHVISREKTKVVVVAAPDAPGLQAKIADLTMLYRRRFRQQSVGIVSSPGCAAF
ncbi:MAG: DUF3574 domain-containing protein [Rhizomicrobium sp.]